MNPPGDQLQHKFSLMPGSTTQLFLLLIVLLLVSMGLIVQSTVNGWLKNRSYQLTDITQRLHQRIETYRYITWQIYDNVAVTTNSPDSGLQEVRLLPNIYYLEKPRHKTEALIYGTHDNSTLEMSDRISGYLDTLWGAVQIPHSMYYLNGQDNSLILVSTLPLKERAGGFKTPDIAELMESRRAEMLQQANTLDVRESFSNLRFLSWPNGYYFTLRTTFNQPGYLATVVAFDLPFADLVPVGVSMDNFQLSSDPLAVSMDGPNNGQPIASHVHIHFKGSHIELAAPVASTRMNILWKVKLSALLLDTLEDTLLPLVINIALLALVLFGYTTFRYAPVSPERTDNCNNALHLLRAMNEEIISLLPIGLLVYDKESHNTVFSNKIADHLLAHLDLSSISVLAEQHQGVIQTTINNEMYEIRLFYSQIMPQTQIFILRDQDKELLVSSKLKQARRLYEKNQRGRIRFMHHLSEALQLPFNRLTAQVAGLPASYQQQLHEPVQMIVEMVDAIQLLSVVDSDSWQETLEPFVVQGVLDDVMVMLLPLLKRKGLQCLVSNLLPASDVRIGDQRALRTILKMLFNYAITTTAIGRITLEVSADGNQLTFCLLDTGNGFTREESENLYFPFLNDTSADEYGKASGLAFYLCNQLAAKSSGQLMIHSQPGLGTRYQLTLVMMAQAVAEDCCERLLDGMVAMVNVASLAVREVVMRRLTQWGAHCVIFDEKVNCKVYDIFFTDNPSNLTASGILLSDDADHVQHYGTGKWRVNFNISRDMHDAVLQLIEEQWVMEDTVDEVKGADIAAGSDASGYYSLFAETVPADVQKLYTESAVCDFAAMAQTAHRLKGVFAMLNLVPGKQLCETLEHHIREKDAPAIEKDISDIDVYINRLLSQGSLNE